LVFGSLLLAWTATPGVREAPGRAVEATALALLLVLLTAALFRLPYSYVYAIFPVVSWAALRFGPRGAATATTLVAGLAIWYTMHGRGPFVASTPTQNLALLQTFVGLLAVTALVLAALVTERTTAEQALTESEMQYRVLFESNPNPLLAYDLDTLGLLAVNEAAVRQYGYTREEFLAMTLQDIHLPQDVPALRDLVAKNEAGLRNRGEWRHRRKDGTIIDVEITRNTLTLAGRPAALAMAHDVTKRKSVETQLLQAQKMEAVGRLAGGIAHDFNNLLTVILGSSDLLLEGLRVDHQSRADLEDIQKAGQRAAALTRQLLAFSRQQVLAPQVLDLNALIADLEKMLRRLIGEDIEFRTVLAPDLGAVRADPGQLEQVIMNLAVNARDAMPHGGKLTVETVNADLDDAYAQAHVPLVAGRYAMLAVSDTGIGMDTQVKAHIFEPFFTTKDKGQGTGLGLATVYGIVKQTDGYIWVYSEPGQGSSFKIYLPRVAAAPEPPAPKPLAPASLAGSETVLLAEDEEAVRNFTRRVLAAHGYTVLTAADGQEALHVAEQHAGPIHLLLTDVVMPNMGGRELAERLVAARHEMKVLYLSGYTDDAIVHHGVLEPGIAFLQKPFTLQGLARKLRDVLDAS
jgi:PAS domain S-box-containing protein